MTTAEYETQSRMINTGINKNGKMSNENPAEITSNSEDGGNSNGASGKSADSAEMKKPQDAPLIQPINLCMLQGAFIVLIVGYSLAGKI